MIRVTTANIGGEHSGRHQEAEAVYGPAATSTPSCLYIAHFRSECTLNFLFSHGNPTIHLLLEGSVFLGLTRPIIPPKSYDLGDSLSKGDNGMTITSLYLRPKAGSGMMYHPHNALIAHGGKSAQKGMEDTMHNSRTNSLESTAHIIGEPFFIIGLGATDIVVAKRNAEEIVTARKACVGSFDSEGLGYVSNRYMSVDLHAG